MAVLGRRAEILRCPFPDHALDHFVRKSAYDAYRLIRMVCRIVEAIDGVSSVCKGPTQYGVPFDQDRFCTEASCCQRSDTTASSASDYQHIRLGGRDLSGFFKQIVHRLSIKNIR